MKAPPRAAGDANWREAIAAPYVYLVQFDVPKHLNGELNRIYDEEHVPHLLEVPGCLGCARFKLVGGDMEGAPRFFALYGLARPDITGRFGPNGAAWAKAAKAGRFESAIGPHIFNRRRLILERIAPPRT